MAEIQNIIELTFTEADGSAFAASALESANNAAESATNAFRYASTASDSADASAESARLSNQFAVNAYDRASAALRAKEGAETAAQQAETSATNAATYEQNAFANAQDAQFQANRAATASQAAVRNASDAAGYAANASSAANNASNSATSAASSATQATSAKDTVVASVTEAAGYASSADSSATQAAQSAATAQTQAQNAMTHASNAQTFANNAQTSATQAAASATTANDSANLAVEVAESIPSDYTTLSNDVDDLKTALSELYFTRNFTGAQYQSYAFLYPLNVGDKYRVSNTGSGAINVRQRETASGSNLFAYTVNAGKTIEFVSTVASNYVVIYFASAGEATFVGLNEKVPAIDKEMEVLELASELTDENGEELWEVGGIAYGSGLNTATTNRLRTKDYLDSSIGIISAKYGYKVGLFAYNNGTYVGMYNGTTFQKTAFTTLNAINVNKLKDTYGYSYKLILTTETDQEMALTKYDQVALIKTLESAPKQSYFLENYALTNYQKGRITDNVVGQVVDMTPDTRNGGSFVCLTKKCLSGDKFVITSQGGDASRAWAFTDDNKKVTRTSGIGMFENVEIIAPNDGWFIFNSTYEVDYSVTYTGNVIADELMDNVVANRNRVTEINNYLPFVPEEAPNSAPVVTSATYNSATEMTLTEIYDGYEALLTAYPEYITKTTLGNDQSNTYPIYRYDFIPEMPLISHAVSAADGTKYTQADMPVVILEACLHGSEKPCARALLNLMDKICSAVADNNVFGWFRRNFHFVVIPVVNPWGYVNTTRYNSRHVDINRNFPIYWENGTDDQTDIHYRGESAGSEVETQYVMDLVDEYSGKAILFYDYHTYGVRDIYRNQTDFEISFYKTNLFQQVGLATIWDITKSGWNNHELPTDSGFIGFVQVYTGERVGMACNYGALKQIPSATPECMYRYNDGTSTDTDYSPKINYMNIEYMMFSVFNAVRKLIEYGW